jgi:hypothetical protein
MTDVQITTHLLDNMRALGVDAYQERFGNVILVDIDATHRAIVLVFDDGAAQLEVLAFDSDGEPCSDEVIDHPVTVNDAETIARLIRSYR